MSTSDSTVTITSTDAANPQLLYTGTASLVMATNRDGNITIHLTDPQVGAPGRFADLYPGDVHPFIGTGTARKIFGYADESGANVTLNESKN